MKKLMPAGVLGWFLFLACSSAFAQGGIYKWTDVKGTIHFSNTPTREAETVNDLLPPAANFERPPEPAPPAAASTTPVPQASLPAADANAPSARDDERPATQSQPPGVEPPAAGGPGMLPAGPSAGPLSSAAGAQPAPGESSAGAESETE